MEPLYTWEFSKRSKFIRAYLWLWDGDPNSITFCKLFWGVLFAWLALLVKPVISAMKAAEKRDEQRKLERSSQTYREQLRLEREYRERRGPNRLQRLLTGIGTQADKVAAFCQTKSVKFCGKVLAVLASLALLSAIVWTAIIGWKVYLVLLGIILVALAAVYLIAFMASVISQRTVDKVRRGFRTVGAFFDEGYHSVKYRTCPKVVVND